MKRIIGFSLAALSAFVFQAAANAAVVENAAENQIVISKTEYRTVTFKVGLHCKNCVKKVNENIAFEKGVKGLEVSLDSKTVKVTYDPAKTDVAKLKAAIEKLGYSVSEEKE